MDPIKYQTEQENFWASSFGDQYVDRNTSEEKLNRNQQFFAKILKITGPIRSVIEFGSNTGMCVRALHRIQPDLRITAVEINPKAAEQLRELPFLEVFNASICEFASAARYDLTFTKGVLIHLNPDKLPETYDKMYDASNKFILVAEYYNPVPVSIDYRGHKNKLFKRDFAGELWDRHPDLRLVDYGFVYHRDPVAPLDDVNWFLFQKA